MPYHGSCHWCLVEAHPNQENGDLLLQIDFVYAIDYGDEVNCFYVFPVLSVSNVGRENFHYKYPMILISA